MQVVFSREQLRQIEAHLEAGYPDEAAGFILGDMEGELFLVKDVLPLDNEWQDGSQGNRFMLTPKASMKAELEAEERAMSVIGVFHSHPDHPAEPSQWDLQWASWPNFAYLITTVTKGRAAKTRAWRLKEDRSAFEEDELIVQN